MSDQTNQSDDDMTEEEMAVSAAYARSTVDNMPAKMDDDDLLVMLGSIVVGFSPNLLEALQLLGQVGGFVADFYVREHGARLEDACQCPDCQARREDAEGDQTRPATSRVH